MGNCLRLFLCRPHGKARFLFHGEREFDASTPINKIVLVSDCRRDLLHPPLPLHVKPEPEEVYYVVADVVPDVAVEPRRSTSFSINVDNQKKCTNHHFVKIIVTKQELRLILRRGKGMAHEGIAVRLRNKFCLEEECRKWRPLLATVPEVQNF